MGIFLSDKFSNLPQPIIVPVPDTDRFFRLHEDFILEWKQNRYFLREGFKTDGASIPRILWPIVGHPFQPRLLAGAILHDALCQSNLIPRIDSDRLLRQLAKAYGVQSTKVYIIYIGVKVGGKVGLPIKTEKSIEVARQFISIDKAI